MSSGVFMGIARPDERTAEQKEHAADIGIAYPVLCGVGFQYFYCRRCHIDMDSGIAMTPQDVTHLPTCRWYGRKL